MRLHEFILMEARFEALYAKYKEKIFARIKQDRSMPRRLIGDQSMGFEAQEKHVIPFIKYWEEEFNRYVEWVLLKWLQGNFLYEDLPRVKTAIDQFDQKKRALEKKDINQYKTLSELEDAVGLLDDVKSARQQKQEIKNEGIKKIVDNDRILLAQLLTEEAASFYGKNTKWCTAGDKNNMFSRYNKKGPIYFLLNKQTNEKFQIHYETASCMDAFDIPCDYYDLLKIAPQLEQLEPSASDLITSASSNFITRYIDTFKLSKRWPEAESYIMKMPQLAFDYAWRFIDGRWPEAEPYIMKDPEKWEKYKTHFGLK